MIAITRRAYRAACVVATMLGKRMRFEEATEAGEFAWIVDAAPDTGADLHQEKPSGGHYGKEPLENHFDSGSVALPRRLLARRLGLGDVHGGLQTVLTREPIMVAIDIQEIRMRYPKLRVFLYFSRSEMIPCVARG